MLHDKGLDGEFSLFRTFRFRGSQNSSVEITLCLQTCKHSSLNVRFKLFHIVYDWLMRYHFDAEYLYFIVVCSKMGNNKN